MQELFKLNTGTNDRVITLKEILDVINADRKAKGENPLIHAKAMSKVENLSKELSFGELVKMAITSTDKGGRPYETYHLTKKQAELVALKLTHAGFSKKQKSNTVYLISDGTYTKIGIAKNGAGSRLKSMQTGNALKLYVVFEIQIENAFEAESYLHEKYDAFRKNGEWFELDDDDINDIRAYLIGEHSNNGVLF